MADKLDLILNNQRSIMLALARLLEIATGEPTTDADVHIENLYRAVREMDDKGKAGG